MTYTETIDYLYNQLPMFQRVGQAAYKKDLSNIIALCEAMGNPHKLFPAIHIAGTNGKGSTAHMMAAIYQAEGYKVGLYTSPHYVDFRERIKINGAWVSELFVIDFTEKWKHLFEEIQPSFFEITVAMCFAYFAEQGVEVAIIETGLGGRLDSTNIIQPLLSIITNISLDHQYLLGDTLEEIAGEKAGIIKENTPVVIGQRQKLSHKVFEEKAAEKNANISFASQAFKIDILDYQPDEQILYVTRADGSPFFERLHLDIAGTYQVKNVRTVLQSFKKLRMMGWGVHRQSIVNGLRRLRQLTNFQGRFQLMEKKPMVICDSGHNEDGIRHAMHELQFIEKSKLILVLGFVNDKKIETIIPLLPKDAAYVFTKPSIFRGMDVDKLSEFVSGEFEDVHFEDNYEAALAKAKSLADEDSLIYIGGSSFLVGEALEKELVG